MGKGIKTFFGILAGVIVVALAAAVVYFVINYVDGAGKVKAFYLRYGEMEVAGETRDFALPRGVATVFEVQTLTGRDKNFTATITPAQGRDFDFTVGDRVLAFSGVADLSAAFRLTKTDGYLSLWLAEGATMGSLLQSLYPDETVTAPEVELTEDYFCLTVTSGDGASSVRLYFH